MAWGGDSGRRRNDQPTFSGPPNDFPAATLSGKPYSYREKSPGYVATILSNAQSELSRFGAELQHCFVEAPQNPIEQQAREYYKQLGVNEQAALLELHKAMKSREGCF